MSKQEEENKQELGVGLRKWIKAVVLVDMIDKYGIKQRQEYTVFEELALLDTGDWNDTCENFTQSIIILITNKANEDKWQSMVSFSTEFEVVSIADEDIDITTE